MGIRTGRRTIALSTAVAVGAGLAFVGGGPAVAGHGSFPVSSGIYRIPYEDGTDMVVSNDHHNHGSPTPNQGNNRFDLVADDPPATVVAAASGVVMAIVDIHGDSDGLGDGLDVNGNSGQLLFDGVTVHADALEHSCQDFDEDVDDDDILDAGEDLNGNGSLDSSLPNSAVIGLCQNYNNYIWIAHPNGEWSKYTHMETGSITGAPGNLSVGDTVLVGDPLGIEADIGRATGRHLHHEIALPDDPTDPTPFDGPFIARAIPGGGNEDPGGTGIMGFYAGGFIDGTNVVPIVCDIPDNTYVDGDTSPGNNAFTANPCTNTAPTADAGGPYVVDEGSTVQLDGTGSSDPENAILSYSWSPATHLDDPTSPAPSYDAIDDTVDVLTLTVSDIGGDVTAATALTDDDDTTVTVQNVPPTVTAVGDAIAEAGTATVTATFTDPGTLDTHTATIDWGYGEPAEVVDAADLAGGIEHVYGDDGDFDVTVTVTDDDGGVGSDTVVVGVSNLDPEVDLDVSGQVSFPGGDYFVVGAGEDLPLSATGEDPGSDDLTFSWSTGEVNTHFNDGAAPDPDLSPEGVFPFLAADDVIAVSPNPGVQLLELTLTDDDGGLDSVDAGAIVTGTADDARSSGWWKHQYSGKGAPHIDADTAQAYLDIVDAVSSVFAEETDAATPAAAHAVLSPTGDDRRARATAELLLAWLQFASGAVEYGADVPLQGADEAFLDLMFRAEEVILDATSTRSELQAIERDLARVVHAD
ncbi:PKD domain-containing protein [Microbacterium sp. NPDC019599]|uniref:M23 family metallopeptidase n=1 Tax=Microbacterium sp. NPDC019599 TaxID=3154690 RepID=UPI0033DEF320